MNLLTFNILEADIAVAGLLTTDTCRFIHLVI
jgi:hypothetical protein